MLVDGLIDLNLGRLINIKIKKCPRSDTMTVSLRGHFF